MARQSIISALILENIVMGKHLAQEKMIGENKITFQEKIEIKSEETTVEKVTTSEVEGVR